MSGRRRDPADRLYVVGVTGGTGTGKTTFVRRLAALGPAVVLDADRIGHDVLDVPAVAEALALAFGPDIVGSRGRVKRAILGRRAFAGPEALARLNAIVHPPLLLRLREALDRLVVSGFEGLAVIDAALLVEWDLGTWCDRVVAVVAPAAAQIVRLVEERGLEVFEAEQRVERQLPNEVRASYADHVLENAGPREEFERDADALAARLWVEARAELARRGRALPA